MSYGKFTERAQLVIMAAQKESQKFKHGYIGTEHILIGIMAENGYSSELLEKYGIEIEEIRNMLEEYLGYGDSLMPKGELLLTPRTKRLFDESIIEAKKLNHKYVSPEHLLLALINEEEGVAYTILCQLRLNFKEIKSELILFLSGKEDEELNDDNNYPANIDWGVDYALTVYHTDGSVDNYLSLIHI